MGGNGVGPIVTVLICIALLTAYWFWDASKFVMGNKLDFSQSSYLPIYCAVNPDRAGDIEESAAAYFWNGNIRIDLKVVNSTQQTLSTIYAHEIVDPSQKAYLWRDDRPAGTTENNVSDFPILSGISHAIQWFCFPWILFDYTKFTTPNGMQFEPSS